MKPKLNVWICGVVLVSVLVVNILFASTSLAATVEESPTIEVAVLEDEINGTTVTIISQEETPMALRDTYKHENRKMESQSITTCPYQSNNSRDTNYSFGRPNDRNSSTPLGTTTITIQPGSSDGKDAFIYQKWPDSNYGSSEKLRVGCYGNEYDYVSVLQFALSSIPTGATINSATLSLYCAQTWGSAQYIYSYQLASSWDESTVTWNNAPNYYTTEYTSAYISGTGWKSWDATDHVQEWWNGQTTNYGLYLRHTTWNDEDQSLFRSSDYSSSSYRPKLVVTYTPPSKPDLIVEDIWVDPNPPTVGGSNRIRFRIKNQGDGDAVGTFRSKLYFDGVYKRYADTDGLTVGSTKTYYWDMTWPPDCNSHTIKVITDADSAISESNEDNNERSESFSANHPPVLSDGIVDPQEGCSDDDYIFVVKYKDQDGDSAVTKDLYVYDNEWERWEMSHFVGNPIDGECFHKILSEFSVGTHNFYFHFTDGIDEDRDPDVGYYSFTVIDCGEPDINVIPTSLEFECCQSSTTSANLNGLSHERNNIGDIVPGRVVIGLETAETVVSSTTDALVTSHDGTIIRRDEALKFVVVEVENDADKFIEEILKEPSVSYAEYDKYAYASMTPNDPKYSQQWGPQKIKAPAAWDMEIGSNDIVIAIIDTGVDYNHQDLSARFGALKGTDIVNNDDDPMPDPSVDGDDHGTHCAGIAAATINNNIGIAGIAQARLLAVKVFNGRNGYTSNEASGIRWAADNDADVVSISLRGGSTTALRNACQYAWDHGCIIIAASGNDYEHLVYYPAAYDTVVAVGAIDQSDQHCSFSNYGPELELSAPGRQILSTILNNQYASWDGTSMATPHVSGVAALTLSTSPSLSNQQVRDILDETADDLGSTGRDEYYGFGRVDAQEAVANAQENLQIITVTNEGDADLVVSNIEIYYQTGEPTGWLDANPKSFTVSPSGSEPVSVCVDCTDLSPDEYHGWLNIRSDDPDEDPYQVSVTLCVNGPWENDPSNPCKQRRLACSGAYEYQNKPDGTICGHGEWEEDPANPCKDRREILKCTSGTCSPSGEYEYQNKPDGTICGCTANNTLMGCNDGTCSDTGICNSTICGADVSCDGKNPGESCGTNRKCNFTCKCQEYDITPPASIANLQNTTGQTWINWTWTNPADADFNHTMVYLNGTWKINTSNPFYNATWLNHSTYYEIGTHTVDEVGNVNATWVNQTARTEPYPAPDISSFAPPSPVYDTEGATGKFNVTVDQVVSVSWQINGTEVQINQSVTETFYMNMSAAIGTWNVSAIASNANGTAMQTWIWDIPDTEPPLSITNLQNTTGQTWINWTWINPPDVDFNHTMVYLNRTWKANASNPFYNATGLNPDTCYEIASHTVDKVGNINRTWINDTATTLPTDCTPPNITSHAPTSPVNDTEGATRTFNITVDQIVDVVWQINGTTVQTDTGVASVSYTNTSAVRGIWNVSAIATNLNGTAVQTWIWNVTPDRPFDPDDWAYSDTITATENSGSDLNDYQILVGLNASNFNFSKAQPDGADIRFAELDDTLLNYWIEDWNSTDESAKIWVKVPSIPANDKTTIRMYYGHAGASDVSDGGAVFILFDDFEDGTVGSSPSGWSCSGNCNNKISSDVAHSGTKSVKMTGVSGGCWESLLHKYIGEPSPYRITFSIYPPSYSASGCHDSKGSLYLHTCASWTCSLKGFVNFERSNNHIHACGSTMEYTPDRWHEVEVMYIPTASDVFTKSYINNDFFAESNSSRSSYEDSLRYLSFGSGDGYNYYDLIYVGKCAFSEPTVTITTQKGDLDHDGNVTSADVQLALDIAFSGGWDAEADIDENGYVNVLDARMIMQAAAGRIEL